MRRPPASRRRIRPTLAAAVGCGILGGSLVGLGALGFDKVEVAAATSCPESPDSPVESPTPMPSPAADPAPDDSGDDSGDDTGDETRDDTGVGSGDDSGDDPTAVDREDTDTDTDTDDAAADSDADSDDDSDAAEPDDLVVEGEPLPGGVGVQPASLSTAPAAMAPRREGTTVAPEIGAVKPGTCAPEDDPDVIVLPGPDEDGGTPTPRPAGTPKPTPRPAVIPPVVTPNPVLPPPSTSTRGYSTTRPPRTPTPGRTGTITRPEVIARAVSWVTQAVPYSQTRWWTDVNGSYRQDCSGYVAMAWRTDQRINYWTGNLGTISDRVPSSAMRPGDILLLPGKHTVIFLGWANQQRTKFHLFEEYRTGTPARFVRNASLSYYLERGYGAYAYEGIRDTALTKAPLPVAARISTPVSTPAAARVLDPDTHVGPSRTDTIALLSAQSSAAGATTSSTGLTWTLEQAVAGLPATDWSPGVAEDYTPESPQLVLGGDADADLGDAALSVDELVDAQASVDRAEEQRLAAAGQSALTLTQDRTSSSGYVLAAGLGLLFLALPLGAAGRGAWTAASAMLPPPPPPTARS